MSRKNDAAGRAPLALPKEPQRGHTPRTKRHAAQEVSIAARGFGSTCGGGTPQPFPSRRQSPLRGEIAATGGTGAFSLVSWCFISVGMAGDSRVEAKRESERGTVRSSKLAGRGVSSGACNRCGRLACACISLF